MRPTSTAIVLLIALLIGSVAAYNCRGGDKATSLRVMTFNIRFGTAPDGENAWSHRREQVFEVIRRFDVDVVGVQEAWRFQLDELASEFPQFSVLGAGREAGGDGEYSSILFRQDRFDVWEAGTFWLSDTPGEPGSTSWGNQLPRIGTWARLHQHSGQRRFYVFNTHWDHQSQPSREQSGQLIATRVAARKAANEPVIVMGDFNAGEANPARRSLDRGREVRLSRTPLPPNRTCGFPAYGFPVSGPLAGIERKQSGPSVDFDNHAR